MNPHRTPPLKPHIPRRISRALPASRFVFLICVPLVSLTNSLAQKSPPPAKPAAQYAAFDAHPDEHVTIAAEPCEEPKFCPFFRLPYIEHGLLPVRVIVTNDSDRPISLADVRMQFISAHNDTIPAATEEDIDRRLSTLHNDQGTHIPIIPITVHHPVDKKISQDDDDFGFKSTTVSPHATLAGYLFYDIRDLDDPALKGAELYVKMVRTLDGAHELFAFSIPFDKWLAANPNTPSNHPRH